VFILPPLAVLVTIVQMVQSPGEIFFCQHRTGTKGRVFKIIKFRTMHSRYNNKTDQSMRLDQRVYSFGRILRKTSIDEIPQFINVLMGDMSVVGPRPHLPIHDKQWAEICDKYNVRFSAKPGITGLAQVKGFRGEVVSDKCILERIRCDLEYIEKWSISMDINIVFRTMWVVVFPKGNAY
jgi:lipopolysaccharide/colanic/teichoic acid biosynthesis glycosyltransferase